MVKRLSVFMGILLVSLFVFSSVAQSQGNPLQEMSNPSRVMAGNSVTAFMSVSNIEREEKVVMSSSTESITRYSDEYAYFFGNGKGPAPSKLLASSQQAQPYSNYHSDPSLPGFDQILIYLLKDLSIVGVIILFLIIRMMYTSWGSVHTRNQSK